MKYLLSLLAVMFGITVFASDSVFTVSGKFEKIKSGKVYLNYSMNEKSFMDSADIKKGKFMIRGFVSEPVRAFLTLEGKQGDGLSFYLEPVKIKIEGDGDSLRLLSISGSIINDDNIKLKKMMAETDAWDEKNSAIYSAAVKAKNKPLLDSLDEVDMQILFARRNVVSNFVKENPSSIRAALAIKEQYAYYTEATDVEPVYAMLNEEVRQSPSGKAIMKMIEVYRRVAIGQPAPDIVQITPEGKSLALSALKGQYVLVDFWASWCGPCRRENPNVVKIFNNYKDKEFTIFGVSYDTKKERWEKAIKDDGLTWSHVSDLKGWKNSTSDQYGIKSIPSNLILDKNGVIIAKNLFGKKLEEKIAEIIK